MTFGVSSLSAPESVASSGGTIYIVARAERNGALGTVASSGRSAWLTVRVYYEITSHERAPRTSYDEGRRQTEVLDVSTSKRHRLRRLTADTDRAPTGIAIMISSDHAIRFPEPTRRPSRSGLTRSNDEEMSFAENQSQRRESMELIDEVLWKPIRRPKLKSN